MNKAWHDKHVMPADASLEKRIRWHQKHAKACACRPVPAAILEEMRKRGLPLTT
jgi:hypothetical protein